MKVAIIIFTLAIAGAFAQEVSTEEPTIAPFVCDGNAFLCKLKELGHHIKFHASKLGGKLKDVGSSVLSAAAEQGKNLLASGAQAVLGTVLEHLNKSGIMGKREIAFFDNLREHLSRGFNFIGKVKEGLKAAFEKAVSKITGVMKDTSALTKVEDDADKKIDDAVTEFKKEGKSGFLQLATFVKSKLKDIFTTGMDKLREIFSKGTEKRAILDNIKSLWESAKGHFSNVVGGIADTFRPHLDALKQGVSGLAAKAKEHGANLLDAAKNSFNDLKGKVSGHIDTLKGHASKLGEHATNALNALKEAVASIALQAVGNVKDTVGDAVNTVKDGAKVVGDHVNDAISN